MATNVQSNVLTKAPARIVQPAGSATDVDVQSLIAYELEPWENALRPLNEEWDKLWEKWWIKPLTAKDTPFLAKVQSSYGHRLVETLVPTILGETPKITYVNAEFEEDDLAAALNTTLVKGQMKRMRFEHHARDYIRQGVIKGFTVAKVGWVREQAHRSMPKQSEHDTGEGFSAVVELDEKVVVTVRNSPFFEVVNTWDFVWPIWSTSLEACPCVWQRRWVTMEYMRKMAKLGVYVNVDQVSALDSGKFQESRSGQFSAQNLSIQGQQVGDSDEYGLVELWERWEDDSLITIANRSICVRDEPNPFLHKRKPFVDWAPIPATFQMHGIGTMRVVNDANEQLGTMRRQMLDAVTISINPMFKVPEGFDRNKILLQPGGVIEIAPDIEDIEPLNIPNVPIGDMLQADQMLKQEMEGTSGVQPLFGGAFQPGGSRTATGWNSITTSASLRPTEMIKQFAERTMDPFARMLLSMNAQFQDSVVTLNISDDEDAQQAWAKFVGVETPPKVIEIDPDLMRPKGDLELIAEVGDDKSVSDQQKRSDVAQFLQAATPMFANPQAQINMQEVFKWAAEQYDIPMKDVQKMLTPLPQQVAAATAEGMPGGPSSGLSGDNAPTGGVVGTAGAAGGVGSAPYAGP